MQERREFVRLDTRLDITYSVLPSGAPQPTVAKDISGSGICLFLDRELPPGTRLQVAMKLPGRAEPVHFTAEIIWSEAYEVIGKSEHTRTVEAGVRFIEIAPQDQETVRQHVILTLKQPGSR